MAPLLIELGKASWHERHENVVRALQALRPPEAVPCLERVATVKHPYLDVDEFRGLGRKCTWALGDIGTPEARAALLRLAQSDDETIAGFAHRRLDRWDDELGRKLG
jgi:hypothetical protein